MNKQVENQKTEETKVDGFGAFAGLVQIGVGIWLLSMFLF